MFDTIKSGAFNQQILSIKRKKNIKMTLRIKIKAYFSFLPPKISLFSNADSK